MWFTANCGKHYQRMAAILNNKTPLVWKTAILKLQYSIEKKTGVFVTLMWPI